MTNDLTLHNIALENKPCSGTQIADDIIDLLEIYGNLEFAKNGARLCCKR